MAATTVKQEELTEYLLNSIPSLSQISEVKCPCCGSKITNIAAQQATEGIASIVLTFNCGQNVSYAPATKKYDMNVGCRSATAILMNQKIDSYKTKPVDNRFEGIK